MSLSLTDSEEKDQTVVELMRECGDAMEVTMPTPLNPVLEQPSGQTCNCGRKFRTQLGMKILRTKMRCDRSSLSDSQQFTATSTSGVQLLPGQETAVKHIRVLYKKEKNRINIRGKRTTEIGRLKRQVDMLMQERERRITELTSVKEQMSQVEASNEKKDQTIVELTRELEANQVERSAHETQTGRDLILYSEDVSKFYPSVTYSSPSADYSHGTKGRWLNVTIERPQGAEPPGKANKATVHVYNTKRNKMSLPDIRRFTKCWFGQKMYYHGTDARSAKSILEHGICLSKSSRNVDFSSGASGGGFYVTDSFEKAEDWSERVLRWRCYCDRAVIGFRINSSLQNEEDHLSLSMSRSSDKKLWEIIVSHFRHGETSPDVATVLKRVKYIEGPVRAKVNQATPSAHDFNQLCIRDSDYARRFGSLENIAFVIFYV